MAMFDTIGFPSHEGLPFQGGPPTIDGFTEPHPGLPVASWRLEAGYVGAAKFDYSGSGAAFPNATFRGVKDNSAPFLYLAFDVRFDPSFNDNDRVFILLRPSYTPRTNSAADRRIDILPVLTGTPTGGGGAPAAPADSHDLAAFAYRTNRPPRVIQVYKRNPGAGDTWLDITPSVTNIEVKVSSSEPSVGPAGARHWTVELKIPTTSGGGQGGGADWVDLTNDFGLYLNMIRICTGGGCGGPEIGGFFSTQFTWPFDPSNPSANLLTDSLMGGEQFQQDWDVSPLTLGHASILAPGASNPARGVKFQGGYQGIGVLSGGAIGGTLDMHVAGANNQLVARLINDHPVNAAPAGITAEFRIADFGLGPYGNNALWRKTPSTTNPAASGSAIPTGGLSSVDVTSQWTASGSDVTRYQGIWSDQCLWVELTGSPGAFLAQSSVRRNLAVWQASEAEGVASVSGDVPDADDNGVAEVDYWLHSAAVRLERMPKRDGGRAMMMVAHVPDPAQIFGLLDADPLLTGAAAETDKDAASFLWVNTGYWRTPEVLTIDGKAHAVWLNSGSFGSVVHHTLEEGQSPQDIGLTFDLSADGLVPTGDGGYSLRVPLKGTKRVWARVRAGTPDELEKPFEPRGDPPEPIGKPGGGDEGGPATDASGCLKRIIGGLGAAAIAVAIVLRWRG
jgi:hypothetical protein